MSQLPDAEQVLHDLDASAVEVRRKALFALGKLLDLRAIPRLKRIAAEDESQEARYLARKLLALYEARKPEAAALIRPGGGAPAGAVPGAALDTPAAIEAALASPDATARAAALKACALSKDPALVPALLARAGRDAQGRPVESVPEVRSMLPLALARVAGRAQAAAIVAFLDDGDPRVRANALTALPSAGDAESWSHIVRSLSDADHRVKTAAIAALSKLGRVNVIACCSIMIQKSGGQYWQKDSAIALLARSGMAEAVPLLEAALTDAVPGVPQKALKGLEELAQKGCEPAARALERARTLSIRDEKPDDFLKLEDARTDPGPDDDIAGLIVAQVEDDAARKMPQRVRSGASASASAASLAPDPSLQTIDAKAGEVGAAAVAGVPIAFSPAFTADYEPVRLLGHGGMGAVYLMKQKRLDRYVAVKVVRADRFTPEEKERLLREARVLAKLNHANILNIHDVGQDGELPYMICEYVEGDTLQSRMTGQAAGGSDAAVQDGRDLGVDGGPPAARPALRARSGQPLPLLTALRIAFQVLDGLSAAHRAGVHHRDLKPANLLLTREGKPKIVDFGLARSEQGAAGAGTVSGTPAYMSPEQARGQPTTFATDLYAMGVILFEMVTGRNPFPGPSVMQFMYQHANEPAPPARGIQPDLPESVDRILARALEKEPAKRFGSAAEFMKKLLEPIRELTGAPPAPTSGPGRRMQDAALSAGTLIGGRYTLQQPVTQSETRAVWLAKDTALDDLPVSVRMLPPALWPDEQAGAALQREGQAWAGLLHPNILRVIAVEAGPPPFLVTEVVDGPTLADELARRKATGQPPLAPDEALPVIEALAAALDHAHAAGVLHREASPQQVLRGATPKLADFGLAAEVSQLLAATTGAIPASAAYLSPEQLTSRPLDARTDVFALAATAHEMLTFDPPGAPPGPYAVPADLAVVLKAALDPDPARRPASAGAFAAQLQAALTGEVPAPDAPPPASPVAVERAGPVTAPPPPASRAARVSRIAAVLAFLAYTIWRLLR